MESTESNKISAFDTLFCTNHIQMLKVILPCLDHQMQKKLAVFIKFFELRYTISFYRSHPYPLCGCASKDSAPDICQLCQELKPFCTESESRQMERFLSLYSNMKMAQEMSESMDFMQSVMPDSSGTPDMNMMDVLLNMMTPEQKQMYDLFGGNGNDE